MPIELDAYIHISQLSYVFADALICRTKTPRYFAL